MPRQSKIQYNPKLSVKANAKKNGVTEDAIRYYIRTRGIDRRYDSKVKVLKEMKAYLKQHPDATRAELAKETGHGINTVRRYWDILHGDGKLKPSEKKADVREQRVITINNKHIAYLDKLPIEFIKEYLEQREAAKGITVTTANAVSNELRSQIESLMEVERANTAALAENPSYLPMVTKQDLYKREKEQYNVAEHYCVAFRRKDDLWKGMRIPFGNMNGGFPYTMHGIEFPTSEHAYIFGLFSNNTPEHIAIQQELLGEASGYSAKRNIRNGNKEQWRTDWEEFNIEWMLHCVWTKVNQCDGFRKLLLAIPKGAIIIEDGSFQNVNKGFDSAAFWGARNAEKKAFGKLVEKYVETLNTKTKKDADDAENGLLWEYCNVGTYIGNNVMGKILTIVKQCLHDGTQPDSDYDLLKSKNIHFLGKLIEFEFTNNGHQVIPPKQQPIAEIEPNQKKTSGNIKCTDKYAYFYQNTPLSNWWTSVPSIPYDGHQFTSSEALFMYLKAKGMGDDEYAQKIVDADNDTSLTEKERFSAVKKLGRKCKFDEALYVEKREEWMYEALLAKFNVDEEFRSVLMAEEYQGLTFVEASPWDAVWGIKSRATQTILDEGESAWKGLNLLGKLLTKLRDEKLGQGASIRCEYPETGMIKSISGGVFGDISGCTRERSSCSVYTTDFDLFPPKSHPTDDSVLTVAIADWLLHKDTLSLSDALRGWGKKYPRAGFGSGFRAYIKSGKDYCSDKNGAAMRVSPVAVVASSLDEALSLAKESALPTHNSEEGIKGAQSIAAAIYLVRDGVAKGKDASTIKGEVKSYIVTTFGYDLDQSIEGIRKRSQRFAEMKRIHRETGYEDPEFRPMSEAAVSVPMAFIAFLEGNSYEDVLRIAISLGGDADTIGCMASSISVHLFGIPQTIYDEGCKFIPSDMMAIIEEFDAKYLSK